MTLWFVLLTKHDYGDQIKQDEVGGVYGLMEGKRIVYSALMRKYEDKSHLEDTGLHGKIIINRSLKK
jgi:hypothetical protein